MREAIDNKPVPVETSPSAASVALRFVIDGSVIECFANTSNTITKRFYYLGPTAPTMHNHLTT